MGVAVVAALGSVTLVTPPVSAATPVTVISHDFEDGTTQGWAPRSDVEAVANTTDVAHGGTHSLATTGRTCRGGADLDVLGTSKGTAYTLSVWVRLAAGRLAVPVERRRRDERGRRARPGDRRTNVNDYG